MKDFITERLYDERKILECSMKLTGEKADDAVLQPIKGRLADLAAFEKRHGLSNPPRPRWNFSSVRPV